MFMCIYNGKFDIVTTKTCGTRIFFSREFLEYWCIKYNTTDKEHYNTTDKEHCAVSQHQAFPCVWGMKVIWSLVKLDIFIPAPSWKC